jgi:hypothetical protein
MFFLTFVNPFAPKIAEAASWRSDPMVPTVNRPTGPVLALLWIALLLLFMLPASSPASDIEIGSDLDQSEFKDLSRQAGIVISYSPLSPAEPLGILGFDVGLEVTVIDIDETEEYWEDTVEDADVPSYIFLPKLHAQKGLPLGIDVGVSYARTPLSNVSVIGGEIKWAFLKGGLSYPAMAIRGSYTQLLGVDDLDLSTYGLDLSISKGFAIFTPYAGIGQIWITSEEHSDLVTLKKENVSATKGFVGLKVSLVVLNLVAEIDFAEIPLYHLRANISF